MSNPVSTTKKLPLQYTMIILPLFLSVIMTFVISGVSTLRGIGFAPNLIGTWMSAWGWSWLVAFPTLLVVLPFVRRLVGLVVEPPGKGN